MVVRGAGATFTVTRKGSVALLVLLPNLEVRRVVLKNVLFSERFPHKIISEIKFSDAGCRIVKQGAQFTVSSAEGRVILEATRLAKRQFFFVIQPSAAQAQAFLASEQAGQPPAVFALKAVTESVTEPSVAVTEQAGSGKMTVATRVGRLSSERDNMEALWTVHCCRMHLNFAQCVLESPGLREPKDGWPVCPACVMSKAKHIAQARVGETKSTRPDQVVSVDFKGPFQTTTPEGFVKMLTFMDVYSTRLEWNGMEWNGWNIRKSKII